MPILQRLPRNVEDAASEEHCYNTTVNAKKEFLPVATILGMRSNRGPEGAHDIVISTLFIPYPVIKSIITPPRLP